MILKNSSTLQELSRIIDIIMNFLFQYLTFTLTLLVNFFLFLRIINILITTILPFFFPSLFINTSSKFTIVTHTGVTMKNIIGLKNAKIEIKEILDMFINPHLYSIKPKKGLLLYGPPGNGKTMFAKAIASELNGIFISTSGSSFTELYVGSGARNVRQLFSIAQNFTIVNKKVIIFIDEIDGVGKRVSNGSSGNNTENGTINELLTKLDGIQTNNNIFVIMATNLEENLDEALIRPGRIDNKIKIDNLETIEETKEFIDSLLTEINHDGSIDTNYFSIMFSDNSRVYVENIFKEAQILAGRDRVPYISNYYLDQATDKIRLGFLVGNINQDTINLTAYHEAGHAFMGFFHNFDVYKITIQARSNVLGYVLSHIDNYEMMKGSKKLEKIDICLAGRICEEIFLSESAATSGCGSDLQKARKIAEEYIISGCGKYKHFFNFSKELSSETERNDLYNSIKELIQERYEATKKICFENKNLILKLVEQVLKQKTLYKNDIETILSNKLFLPIPYNIQEFK